MFHDIHRFVPSNSFSCLDHLNGSSGIGGRLVISRLLVSTYLTARGPCNVSDWSNEEKTTNRRLLHGYGIFQLMTSLVFF